MVGWLKKLKRRKAIVSGEGKRIAVVKKRITKTQQKIADHLGEWDSLLTTKERKIALLIFFSAMFTLSGWMLYDGIFRTPQGVPDYLERQAITRPESTDFGGRGEVERLTAELGGKSRCRRGDRRGRRHPDFPVGLPGRPADMQHEGRRRTRVEGCGGGRAITIVAAGHVPLPEALGGILGEARRCPEQGQEQDWQGELRHRGFPGLNADH